MTMIKMAGDNDGDDDDEEEDVVDGINGDDDDDDDDDDDYYCLYLFIKALFLEFRSIHNTLQSTISLPLCSASSCCFVSSLNCWTQNCWKSQISRLPKVND